MEVRVYSKEDVELFLLAREEGMNIWRAAEIACVKRSAMSAWVAESCRGRTREGHGARVRFPRRRADTKGANVGKCDIRGLHEPVGSGPLSGMAPDQIESLLLGVVLDDLKRGGLS